MGDLCALCNNYTRFGLLCANDECNDDITLETVAVSKKRQDVRSGASRIEGGAATTSAPKHAFAPDASKKKAANCLVVCLEGQDLEDLFALEGNVLMKACKEIAVNCGFNAPTSVTRWSETVAHAEFPDAIAAGLFLETTAGSLQIRNQDLRVSVPPNSDSDDESEDAPHQIQPPIQAVQAGKPGCRWCRLNECWDHQFPQQGQQQEAPKRPRQDEEASTFHDSLAGVNSDMWASYLQMCNVPPLDFAQTKRQRGAEPEVDEEEKGVVDVGTPEPVEDDDDDEVAG